MNPHWVVDLSNYKPTNLKAHWGRSQAGFNISRSGKIWLTDNKNRPCHRDLIDGEGDDCTMYSGIYSWYQDKPEIYIYPALMQIIHTETVQAGLRSLVGVHLIHEGVPVINNCSRQIVMTL